MEPAYESSDINSTNTMGATNNNSTSTTDLRFFNETFLSIMCNPCVFTLIFTVLNFMIEVVRKSPSRKIVMRNRKLKWFQLALTLCMVFILPWSTEDQLQELDTGHTQATPESLFSSMWSPMGLKLFFSPASSYILIASLMFLDNVSTWNMTTSILVFWCATLASLSKTLVTNLNGHFHDYNQTCLDIVHVCFVLLQCVLFSLTKSDTKTESGDSEFSHPKLRATWLSDALLLWTTGVIWTGWKKTLEETDLPPPLFTKVHSRSISKFELSWKIERFKKALDQELKTRNENEESEGDLVKHSPDDQKQATSEINSRSESGSSNDKRISLLKVLIQTFGVKFFAISFIIGSFQMAHFVGPVLLNKFMIHIQNRDTEHWTKGVGIVVIIFVFNVFKTVCNHRLHNVNFQIQMQIQRTIMLAVVKKSLTIKNECSKDLTTGEIVNLISHDSERMLRMGQRFFLFIACPMSIITAMYLLYVQVGEAMYVGLLLMILLMPINRRIGKKWTEVNNKFTEVNDSRTKIMNEIVNGIKVLKLYAWEPSFISQVQDIRYEGERINSVASVVDAGSESMFRTIPFLVKLTAFGVYLLMGGHIDAATGFASMHLITMLNDPLGHLAIHIPMLAEAFTALKRVEKYLNGDDIPRDIVTERRKGHSAVVIENGMFSWERNGMGEKRPNLRNINIDIPKGGLVAVVGAVGEGKSSLLSAILGEMEKLEGDVEVQGRVAYVPQEAWILNASVRDNVLFGLSHEKRRYRQIVSACSLSADIKNMAARDLTEIGEKGINLSGGQRQRVSLARAVYNDADVYLLDDPLSAVDAHVGKHIFQKVIGRRGLLKDKTRVLVTHGMHWLPFVDSIIVVKDGEISETGTFEELTSYDGDFAQFARQALRDTEKSTLLSPSVSNVRHQIFVRLNSLNDGQIFSPEIRNDKQNPFFRDIPKEEALSESFTSEEDEKNDNENDDDVDVTENSEISSVPMTKNAKGNPKQGAYIEEESVEDGRVRSEIYLEYARAIGFKRVAWFCVLYCCSLVFQFINNNIVQQWTDDPLLGNASLSLTDQYSQAKWKYYSNFAITGFFQVVCAFVFVISISRGTYRAATILHNKLLHSVLRCPLSFFNTTPSSRIVGRFSKDLTNVDGLGLMLRQAISRFSTLCTDLILITINCPAICTTLIPVFVTLFLVYTLHSGTLRQLKRFKSRHRSPIYTHFTEVLDGRACIRAFCAQNRFIKAFEDKLNTFNNVDLWENLVIIGLSMRLILQYRVVELITCLICVMDTTMSAGMVGVVTMYAGLFCDATSSLFQLMAHIEVEIVSLEKVIEYTKKQPEATWEVDGETSETTWPTKGAVVFSNYQARYHENSELALRGINCHIESGQRVGIVGRTGAGKTSLTMALFRLFEASSGSIFIDGKDIAELGLHRLRRNINVLPQEPVIFKGSLRMNLDPFGKSTESDLWRALSHAHLASFVEGLPDKLDFECGEGGKNLSVGQRQLLCLARTLIRKTKILVLDEATAAVDVDTDELIQKTIASEFKGCTVLTIAHRLNTVIDYDKILVLDQGLVKEFDSPKALLKNKSSVFYSLAKDAKLV